MKYQFISDHQHCYAVEEMCEAFALSPGSYYRWKTRSPSARSLEDAQVKEHIMRIYDQAKGRYGYRPIYHHLKDEGIFCGRDRTLRLMNEMSIGGIQKKRFKPLSTDSNHRFGYSGNLLKNVGELSALNQVWVADTTYLLTNEVWHYLATVMDLFSRRIIGWSISSSNNTKLVSQALKAAVSICG